MEPSKSLGETARHRYLQYGPAARLEHAEQLTHAAAVVDDVLQETVADDGGEVIFWIRDGRDVHLNGHIPSRDMPR